MITVLPVNLAWKAKVLQGTSIAVWWLGLPSATLVSYIEDCAGAGQRSSCPTSLQIPVDVPGKGSMWAPAIHVGDPNEALGIWLWIAPGLAIEPFGE